ncbi:MAG: right-handed parallel beta-helix repeat-containing protein, partial [Saprospiraceae bacterium]|nr:right-handed parallel beta-helix repeat-containing protein [Saprospiraceae bacterium]
MKGFVLTPMFSGAYSNAQNHIACCRHRLMGSFLVFGLIAGLVTLSTEEVKAQCNLLNETFDVNPVLSPTNVDGAWYPDRYPPAGFSSGTIGGSNALKISISAADGAQNRPPAYSGQFYNTQGRKLNQCGKCVTSVKGDIWIPADWATKHRRTDMWATAFDISDAISDYPIIGFANVDGASPTLRYWDGTAWVNVAGLAYDTWITLEASLSGGNIVYKVNGTTVGTVASAASVYYGDIIMQAYNFNDNTLPPAQYDPSADNTYDAWWDNLITNGVTGGNVVKNLTTNKSFCSLQEAIDDAATLAGHTLKLEGNLSEDLVVVNKAVIIDGDGKILTSTTSATYGIEVAVANVTIQNLTVFDATTFGIQVDCDAHNLVMTNVTVNSSGGTGIGINGSDNVVLTNLTTTNNVGNGLSITDCNNLTINGFTSSGNAFSPAFSAGIGLFTSGVYCPPAGINGFTLTGTVSIGEPVKVYSQKVNANDVITGLSGASIDWAVGVGPLNKSYWPDQATAYAVAAASFDAPFSYSNTLVYVEDIATGNFYVDDDPAGDASTPMTVQAAVDYIASGKTIFLEDGAYNQRVTISKSLTLDGNGALNSVLFGTGLSSGASGITINSGVTNVTIQDLAVTQYTGSTPNTTGGIYAAGGNNNLTIKNCDVYNNPNCSGIYIEGNANISNVLIDNVKSFGHGAPGNFARGIVIWNGVKSNITIQNCEVYNNNCCGIELQDGSATGITIKNNNVHDNSDSGISPIGLSGPGANLIENNTVTNNGRFGIEVKLPNGSGATSGAGSIVVQGNTVTRTVSIIPENRDIAGISVYRRGALSTGNVNIPTGVVIQNNTVSGYSQPSTSDGFGIVVEGTNHIVQNNTVSNNNVGIQQQAGHTPYVENVGGGTNDGDQSNLSDQYFGRGNAPFTCGNVITGNTFSGNTTNTRNVGAGVNTLAGVVFNTSTGETFCSLQQANDDSNTANGNIITAEPGTYVAYTNITKSLSLRGAQYGVDPRPTGTTARPGGESILLPPSVNTTDGALISVSANNVTIDGFTFNGNNTALSGGININGVDLHAARAVHNLQSPATGISNLTFKNNITQNLYRHGVYLFTPSFALQQNNLVEKNVFDNIHRLVADGTATAVYMENESTTDVKNNKMTRVGRGIMSATLGSMVNAPFEFSGNEITSYFTGIWVNNHHSAAPVCTVANNTLNTESGATTNRGMQITSMFVANSLVVNNNTVGANAQDGLRVWNTSAEVTVSNMTITNPTRFGVFVVNNYAGFGDATSDTKLKLSNVDVSGGLFGINAVDTTAASKPIVLTVTDDCDFSTATTAGIRLRGTDVSASITANDASIHGNPIGIDVDGSAATIQGNHIYDNTIGIRFTNGGTGTVNNLNNFDGGASPDNGRDIQATATAGAVTATPNNSFAGNTYGVENLSATNIDASYCYWEDPNGPGPVGPIGAGANITTKVLYCPWLNAAPPSGTPVGPVKNTTTLETFCTIQAAIDDANTADGHTLEVSPGTYNEQLLVNKSLTLKGVGASQPVIDFTGTISGKPALADVSKPGVTFDNLKFKVDLTKLSSAIIASASDIDNFTVKNSAVEAYGSSGAASYGSYSNRNAISINYGGPIDYRIAVGGVDNVTVQNSTVSGVANDGFGQPRYFRAAVALDEGGGSFTGNTFQTINHDVLVRFASNGNVTISNNNFNGGGVELSDINAGAATLTVSNNIFDATFANVSAPGAAVLRMKNNQQMKTTQVSGNTFSNHEWAVSLENYNSVTLDNNSFTPKSGSTTYHHIAVNTKSISTNSALIVQTTVGAVLTNNIFNGSGTPGGTALSFHNHDSDAAAFGTFTIGTPGNENNFNSGIATFIRLDDQTGTSSGATFPAYTSLIGAGANALTTMACWVPDVNVQNNKFDVGAGLQLPSAMSFAQRTTLETNLYHRSDNLCLGNLIYIFPVHNLTQNTYYLTIQEAINAANASDVIECEEYTFREKVNVSKTLTLKGVSEANTIIDGTGLGNGSGVTIASGVTNVGIEKFTIKNHNGTNPNTFGGIYAPANNSGLNVQHCTIKDNVGCSGFYANGPVNGLLLNNLDVSGHPNTFGAARGIVVWNGFKENITITNCDVYNNNCCGIELQDGTASGVTMTGNNVYNNGDNGIGLSGLKGGTGANLIANNTLSNNGRFGIEVKNPNGTGQTSGTGSIVVENNTVNFTASPSMNNRDHAGIAVFRRAFLMGNSEGYPNIPTGVVVRNNTVAGYKQQNPGSSEKGYGIVIEGTNHSVLNNTVNNNDFGIQEQGGLHPNANYVPDNAGDGNQENGMSANYFGR